MSTLETPRPEPREPAAAPGPQDAARRAAEQVVADLTGAPGATTAALVDHPLPPLVVTEIAWERVHLTLTVAPAEGAAAVDDLSFALANDKRALPLDVTRDAAGRYLLSVNVTNAAERKQIPDGTWFVVATAPDGRSGEAGLHDLRDVERLDDDSRVFLYNQNKTAYTVTFGITESDDPVFVMRTYQLFRGGGGRRSRNPVKRLRALGNLRNRKRLANSWYRLARRLSKPTGNRVLFASEARNGIEGNLLRVRDRMLERGLDQSYDLRYSFRTPATATRRSTLRAIWLLATSDVVLIDDYFGMLESLDVDPSTTIIQVWHAGSGFKAIGFSRFGKYGSPKLQNAHRSYTYAITGSSHLVPVYAEAFGIEESALVPTGLPRIDTFLDPERTAQVRAEFFERYPQLEGKRIVMFAPTFRGRGMRDAYYDYDRLDLDRWYEECGDDTVVLFRMHHFVDADVPIRPEHADRLIDMRGAGDTNDLLLVTDVLITDYSSVIYEYSLLDRPMLFYAYDKDVYGATRGFHRDYDETAPGRVCETFDDLLDALRTREYGIDKVHAFRDDNFDFVDTEAADRVIDWLVIGRRPEEAA